MNKNPVPDRFKGIPEAEDAWKRGRDDGAALGAATAILFWRLRKLKWLLLIAGAALAFAYFR